MKIELRRISSLILASTLIASNPIFVYANEVAQSKAEASLEAQLQSDVQSIEDLLSTQGTNVSAELNSAIQRMKNDQLTSTSQEDRDKLQALIDATQQLSIDYENYSNNTVQRGISHPVLTPAVAAVASYFSASGYLLSFELLVHAQDNNIQYSTYTPYYGSRILSSSVVQKIKQKQQDDTNSAVFEKTGSTVEQDLYYAIHKFNYSFVRSTGKFTLTDTYDFDYGDYEGIANAAIDTMWQAQIIGVLVPYYVKIIV